MAAISPSTYSGPYTANGSQTAFPFDFTANSSSEVSVDVDGVIISSSLYTVAVNANFNGGTVNFLTAPASGAVTLYPDPDFLQSSEFENEGAYKLSTVNTINRRASVRDLWLRTRALIFSPTGIEKTANRVGKFMSWGAAGVPVLASGTGADSALRTDLATTAGALLVGHNGESVDSALFTIYDRGAGTSGIMETSLSRAGAVGNGVTIDTAAIQAAVSEVEYNTRFETYASNTPFLGAGELVWPQGLFLVDDRILITRSLSIRGEGQTEYSSGARIQQQTAAKDIFRVQPIAQGCSLGVRNMVLRANGHGDVVNGGALIRITSATGTCNSVRIEGCVFGTPQKYAIRIDASDDVLLSRNLYDVSALECLSLGSASGVVSRFLSQGDRFFAITGTCVELYNVRTAQFQNAQVYVTEDGSGNPTSRTALFIDGNGTTPVRLHGVGVYNSNFKGVNQLAKLGYGSSSADVTREFAFIGNTGTSLGQGTSTYPAIELLGQVTGYTIRDNQLSGSYGTKPFIDDSGAAALALPSVGGNTLTSTSGAGPAVKVTAIGGAIAANAVSGFTSNSIGCRFATTGSAITPGTVAAAATYTPSTLTVAAARIGDTVDVRHATSAWPDGIIVSGSVTALNTVTLKYSNITGSGIAVSAHDVSILVTR